VQTLEEAMQGEYDLKIGVRDRDALAIRKVSSKLQGELLPKANKVLIVFGSETQPLPKEGLDLEVNVAEYSQSRAVRVEEAVWMALTGLRPSFLTWLRKP
jgi:Putative RNA methyltransferase